MRRVLTAAASAGVKRVVGTSAANAASPSSYALKSVSDETVWTDPDDPTLIPYRRAKTIGEKAAWDFMAGYDGFKTFDGPARRGLRPDPLGGRGGFGRHHRPHALGPDAGHPRIGFEIVDVRDLADVHLRAMTDPAAAGQRFLATGDFVWMHDIARILRTRLGESDERSPPAACPTSWSASWPASSTAR